MVQIPQQTGDTFGEKNYVVSKMDIREFRRRLDEENKRDPGKALSGGFG